jgi:uncharacterized membrane protein (Fun14 family)
MISLGKENREKLLALAKERGIYLEGSIIDQISIESDEDFGKYLSECRKMLMMSDMAVSNASKKIEELESAKKEAEEALELSQNQRQAQLIGIIVKVALWVIIGVGAVVTSVYLLSMFTGKQSDVLEATWSNILGILLTNSFSIIGTIMGVKYASEKSR